MVTQRKLRAAPAVLALGMLATACGENGDRDASANATPTPSVVSVTTTGTSSPSGTSPTATSEPTVLFDHRFFPVIEPALRTHVTYLPTSFEEYASRASVVFTGRVRNVVQDHARTAVEDDIDQFAVVYDGIVFDIEEILVGEVRDGSKSTVTLSFQATWDYVEPDRADRPLESLGFEILEDGVASAQRGSDGPLYVIFAQPLVIGGSQKLSILGHRSIGLVTDGVISGENGFIVDRQFNGNPMTVSALKEWLTDGVPRWDPSPENYPPKDAPAGPIAIPGEESE